MSELKVYSVSDDYISYLRGYNPNVYSNKTENRIHSRKYLGVLIHIADYRYCIPMSSPKRTDYQWAGDGLVIKKSIVPIIRMVDKDSKGNKELKGTLRISHMIPVPESELELYDLENELDESYKALVQKEVIFIRKNSEKIIANANLPYKQKTMHVQSVPYVESALDYKSLETLCDTYIKETKEDGQVNKKRDEGLEEMTSPMTPIRLNLACIPCLLKNRLTDYPEGTPKNKQIEYMQRVLKVLADAPNTVGAPVIVQKINEIQKDIFGYSKNFAHVKHHFNELMMTKIPIMRERLAKSKDSMKLAIQYAMVGNYIDFGAMNKVDEETLQKFFDDAAKNPIDEAEYGSFKTDIEKAKHIVYLTDNCGEIVTDRVLIEEIQKQNPEAHITAIVRGEEVLNDATMEDAVQVGLTSIVEVIGNGSGVAGTDLTFISEAAKQKIEEADVIIAKGQGNFETLQMCGKNVYYIFMCKCDMFASRFQVPKYYGMFIRDQNIPCA